MGASHHHSITTHHTRGAPPHSMAQDEQHSSAQHLPLLVPVPFGFPRMGSGDQPIGPLFVLGIPLLGQQRLQAMNINFSLQERRHQAPGYPHMNGSDCIEYKLTPKGQRLTPKGEKAKNATTSTKR